MLIAIPIPMPVAFDGHLINNNTNNDILGLGEGVTDQDVKNSFYAFGEIRSLNLVAKQENKYFNH